MTNQRRSIFEDYETDYKLEREGAWVTTSLGYEFKVARLGGMNFSYNNFIVEKTKSYQAEIRNLEERGHETLTEENAKKLTELGDKLNKVLEEAFARFVLKGWRNIYDRDGKEITYNVENAIKLMSMRELYNELYPMAQEFSTFLSTNLEGTAKN